MKRLIALLCFSALAGLSSCSENAAASPDKAAAPLNSDPAEKEKAFLAAFRQALEKKDAKALDSLLLKDGTPADVLEFFVMMLDVPEGMKIESLELFTPSPEESEKYKQAMEMPDGKSYKLPLAPTKTLRLMMKEVDSSSTSKSSLPVAEKDGKLIIPLPVAAA